MASHAASDEQAGRSGSDRGTSQFAESSKRETAEHQQGEVVRGLTDTQHATGQQAREASTSSQRTDRPVSSSSS